MIESLPFRHELFYSIAIGKISPPPAGKGRFVFMVTLTLTHFLIVCPLVFLAGFVDAVAGGGGLISLPAYLISGLPVHNAIGTNKLSSFMGTSLATYGYARKGYIPWKLSSVCVVIALIGSTLGANLALLIDDSIFKLIMLIILPLTGVYVMRSKSLQGDAAAASASQKRMVLVSLGAALVIGIYDGFYGPGTGTFLLLILTGLGHMSLQKANGISKAINLATNAAALVVYLQNGKVLFSLGLAAGAFSLVGSWLGVRFFEKGGSKSVKLIIPIVLVLFFIKILSEMLPVWLTQFSISV